MLLGVAATLRKAVECIDILSSSPSLQIIHKRYIFSFGKATLSLLIIFLCHIKILFHIYYYLREFVILPKKVSLHIILTSNLSLFSLFDLNIYFFDYTYLFVHIIVYLCKTCNPSKVAKTLKFK